MTDRPFEKPDDGVPADLLAGTLQLTAVEAIVIVLLALDLGRHYPTLEAGAAAWERLLDRAALLPALALPGLDPEIRRAATSTLHDLLATRLETALELARAARIPP